MRNAERATEKDSGGSDGGRPEGLPDTGGTEKEDAGKWNKCKNLKIN